MATELDLHTLTQLQKFSQSKQNQNHDTNLTTGSWMRYPKAKPYEPDDDSWEVRAFAEDTSNAMGTTWPPRSYTCTFCRREFRSAQALGGHMNVHRRDRAARLHQTPVGSNGASSINTNSSQTTQEFATNGAGLCFLYQLHNPNGIFTSPPPMNRWSNIGSSPHPSYNLMAAAATSINFPVSPSPVSSSSSSIGSADNNLDQGKNMTKGTSIEELDLELRLGHRYVQEHHLENQRE